MDKRIKLSVDFKDYDRVAIGSRLYDALDLENCTNVFGYDEDSKKFILSYSKILELVKLVNCQALSMFGDTKVEIVNDVNSLDKNLVQLPKEVQVKMFDLILNVKDIDELRAILFELKK